MIKSMTGFGRCEVTEGQWKITVEIKAVNHRYLDLNLKVPKKLGMFDGQIRTLLKEYIERGKVDVFVSYENLAEGETSLKYNKELASQYLLYLNQMAEDFGLEMTSAWVRFPAIRMFLQWKRQKLTKLNCGQFWSNRSAVRPNILWKPGRSKGSN